MLGIGELECVCLATMEIKFQKIALGFVDEVFASSSMCHNNVMATGLRLGGNDLHASVVWWAHR